MWRDGVDPAVERRIELGEHALLPLGTDEAEQELRLVDCELFEISHSSLQRA